MHISFLKLLDVQGFFAIYVESNVVINYPLGPFGQVISFKVLLLVIKRLRKKLDHNFFLTTDSHNAIQQNTDPVSLAY